MKYYCLKKQAQGSDKSFFFQKEAIFDQETAAAKQVCRCHPYTGRQNVDCYPQSCFDSSQQHIHQLTMGHFLSVFANMDF